MCWFITVVIGTFFGMSESGEASGEYRKGAETATNVDCLLCNTSFKASACFTTSVLQHPVPQHPVLQHPVQGVVWGTDQVSGFGVQGEVLGFGVQGEGLGFPLGFWELRKAVPYTFGREERK
jgi:hypothetical protein